MACELKPSANGLRIAYVKQTDCETIPANPVFQTVGVTAETMSGNIGSASSSEIYSDRNVRDTVRVSSDVGGDISVEWRINALSELIYAGLQADNMIQVSETGDLTITASTGAISATTPVFANILPGYFIKLGGFADPLNNVVVRVVSKTDAQNIVVSPAFGGAFANENAAAGTVKMYRAKNGTTRRHYAVEKTFTDMSTPGIFRYKGSQVSALNFTFGSQSILTGSVGFIGLSEEVGTTEIPGATYTAPSSDPILDTTTAVGELFFEGAVTSYDVMELSIGLNNNSRGQTAIRSEGFVGITHGECSVEGNISTYFENVSQYQAFLNQDKIDIDVPLEDSDGNAMIASLANVKHQDMNVNATGTNTDVMASGTYKALMSDSEIGTIAFTWFEEPDWLNP